MSPGHYRKVRALAPAALNATNRLSGVGLQSARMQALTRDETLAADDATLLSQCAVDTYRASGPGGQKRNKTSSAVRLRHGPSGLAVIAEESRSQHENKRRALRRLRLALAIQLRSPIGDSWSRPNGFAAVIDRSGRIAISPRNVGYPRIVAVVLDVIAARGGRLRESAELLCIAPGRLSRFICAEVKVLAAANRIRREAGLLPLRSSGR